jgi:hypothetical protein
MKYRSYCPTINFTIYQNTYSKFFKHVKQIIGTINLYWKYFSTPSKNHRTNNNNYNNKNNAREVTGINQTIFKARKDDPVTIHKDCILSNHLLSICNLLVVVCARMCVCVRVYCFKLLLFCFERDPCCYQVPGQYVTLYILGKYCRWSLKAFSSSHCSSEALTLPRI